MIRKTLCLVVACLLAAGCSVIHAPSRKPTHGVRLFPTGNVFKPKKKAFLEAVERDPFPPAKEIHLRAECVLPGAKTVRPG